jgi:hypothetical protein
MKKSETINSNRNISVKIVEKMATTKPLGVGPDG